jgi:hypothetical protein
LRFDTKGPGGDSRAFFAVALTPSGHVRYTLKTPHRDGTTHVVVEPVDFVARLAARVPPLRVHLRARRCPAGAGGPELRAGPPAGSLGLPG